MINMHIIPSVKSAGVGNLAALESAVATLKSDLADIHHTEDQVAKVQFLKYYIYRFTKN